MEISIFEVLGPVMIGPSSSHTAGAARLARVAAELNAQPFHRVEFGLSGSFAQTGRGHGTHTALLAGVLGIAPDDERLRDARRIAAQRGVIAVFAQEELGDMHENSAHIRFFNDDGSTGEVWGSSIGGGRILVTRVGDFETKMHAENPTMMVSHRDRPGVIGDVSTLLAQNGVNIAVLRLGRQARGKKASAVFVMDQPVSPQLAGQVRALPNVEEVIVLDV